MMIARWIQSRQVQQRMQVIAQALAWGGLLGVALFAVLQHSAVRASIVPPVTPDFTFNGSAFSEFGFAVAPAGDINADGYADLLVGAHVERQVYVYTGSADGFTHTALFSHRSDQQNDHFGWSVDGGGDVNGDGVDDFIVGAYEGDMANATSNEGIVYVLHGAAAVQPSLAITVAGETSNEQFGYSAALAGDVNDDGYTDLIVGAWKHASGTGRVYIYHGSASGIQPTPELVLNGEASVDGFGVAVDGAGDVDGDGFDDVVIGAWHNAEGGYQAGKVYVYFGSDEGISPHDPFTVIGSLESELGAAVASAGDVNGDGYADIIAGAYRDGGAATGAGAVYLYWGSQNGPVAAGVRVAAGEAAGDGFGFAVSGAGDINGDGFDDLLAGAYLNSEAAQEAGKAYAYGGCMGGLLPGTVFSDTGEYGFDAYGRAVAGIGDVNGDGVDDIAVGAFSGKRPEGELLQITGKVFVYYGVAGGGCEAQIEVDVTLGLADSTPIQCGVSHTLTVPPNTNVAACYRIENTGMLTLTQHTVIDGLWGQPVTVPPLELAPNEVYTHVVTHVVTADASGPITWTAGVPIFGPGGTSTNPPGKAVTATASATATVILLPSDDPPTVYLPLITHQ